MMEEGSFVVSKESDTRRQKTSPGHAYPEPYSAYILVLILLSLLII